MMTPHTIQLVQASFAHISPDAPQIVDLFFARLFQLDPTLRNLFALHMAAHKYKFIHMLGLLVNGLDNPEALSNILQPLLKLHRQYDIQQQHYETMGNALLWTLKQSMGDAFTPNIANAWATTYTSWTQQ